MTAVTVGSILKPITFPFASRRIVRNPVACNARNVFTVQSLGLSLVGVWPGGSSTFGLVCATAAQNEATSGWIDADAGLDVTKSEIATNVNARTNLRKVFLPSLLLLEHHSDA